jgi:hypothetical protein
VLAHEDLEDAKLKRVLGIHWHILILFRFGPRASPSIRVNSQVASDCQVGKGLVVGVEELKEAHNAHLDLEAALEVLVLLGPQADNIMQL